MKKNGKKKLDAKTRAELTKLMDLDKDKINKIVKDMSHESKLSSIIDNFDKARKYDLTYVRNFDVVEKEALTKDAIGFLMNLYSIGSIDSDIYERIINLCIQIYYSTHKRINKDKIEKLVVFVAFSSDLEDTKDVIEYLFSDDINPNPKKN